MLQVAPHAPRRPALSSDERPAVCQLVHALSIGGAEVLVNRLVRRLDDQFRFVVVSLESSGVLGDELIRDGYPVYRLDRRPGFDFRSVRRLATILQDEGVTLVHAHQYTPFAFAAATRTVGCRPRILFTEHGRFYPDYASRKRRLFNRIMTRRGDRFVAVGGAVRDALVRHEGLPAGRIEVVYNGVDLSTLETGDDVRGAVRDELGVADEDFAVLQVARLDAIKDHGTALRAVAAAVAQQPRIKLLIVGDGPERARIERQITDLDLAGAVKLLGLRRDVPRLLAAADAFLLTSVSEGIPMTVIEAMGAGVPVVATAVGGVPEVIETERSGLLAPAGNAAGLAQALCRLAHDAALAPRLVDSARRRAQELFSEPPMIDRYAEIYREMCSAQVAARSSVR